MESPKVKLTFPAELLDAIDAVAPKGKRAAWVLKACWERLARLETAEAVREAEARLTGTATDKPQPQVEVDGLADHRHEWATTSRGTVCITCGVRR